MDTESGDSQQKSGSKNIEFRVMPNGGGSWYWEIIRGGREVMMRGLADNEPAACQEASAAARKANLIP
jgi:hypothetical protein